MDNIEAQLLKKYADREEVKSYYELLKAVPPNRTPKLAERVSEVIITSQGVVRQNYYRGKTEGFCISRRKNFPAA